MCRRYAVYYTPPPDSRLSRFGAAVLGYDCDRAAAVPRLRWADVDAAAAEAATAEPARYGFHGTLVAPFALAAGATEKALAATIQTLAATRRPVALGPLELRTIGRFTALVPARADDAIAALATACVEACDPLRAPLTEADRARRLAAGLTPRQIALMERWGYPYVNEEFRFHMTLTGPLPEPERGPWRARLEAAARAQAPEPVTIDALSLVVQEERAGRFRVLARHPLTG
jgi:putative phosphonate metabolism protein